MALSPASSRGGSLPSTWTVAADGSLIIAPTGTPAFCLKLVPNINMSTDALTVLDTDGLEGFKADVDGDIKVQQGGSIQNGLQVIATALNDALSSFGNSGAGYPAMLRLAKEGAVILQPNAAPADAVLAASECALWFDSTNGAAATKLMVKGKSADGTVKTAAIVLT